MDFSNAKAVTFDASNATIVKSSDIPSTVVDSRQISCVCLDVSNPETYDALCKIAEAIAPRPSCDTVN